MHETTANSQGLFLVKAWITFLEKKKCPCFLAMRLAFFTATWQKGPNTVNMEILRSACQARGHLPGPHCPHYSSWPTLKLLPSTATLLPIFSLNKNPHGRVTWLSATTSSTDIHKDTANCVCGTEVGPREAFHTPFSEGGEEGITGAPPPTQLCRATCQPVRTGACPTLRQSPALPALSTHLKELQLSNHGSVFLHSSLFHSLVLLHFQGTHPNADQHRKHHTNAG